MKKRKINLRLIIGLGLISLLAVIAFRMIPLNQTEASAAAAFEMTDTDQKAGFTIQDYAAQVNSHNTLNGDGTNGNLFGKNVAWMHFRYIDADSYNCNLSDDDPIVEIIPKNYFKSAGMHSYLGREYGYYIECTYNDKGYYESEVVVIDVISEINTLPIDPTASTFTVQIIFQSKYVYVPKDCNWIYFQVWNGLDSARVGYFSSNSDGCVAPLVKINGNNLYDSRCFSYQKELDLKLQDVSFVGALKNVYARNYGEKYYDSYNDKGGFFREIYYKYPGSVTVPNKTPSSAIWDITDFVIGAVLPTPFDIFYGAGSTIISASVDKSPQKITIDLGNPEYNNHTYYSTTANHLLHLGVHGGELLKYFHAQVNANGGSTVRFGTNQYAYARFGYNYKDGEIKYTTDLDVGIGLKIVKGDSLKTGLTSKQTHRVIEGAGKAAEINDYPMYTIGLNNMGATTPGTVAIYERYSRSWHLNSSGSDNTSGITKPKKTGYVFSGYWTGQEGTGTKIINSDGSWVPDTTDTFTASGTLYAYWVAESFSYSLINNGTAYSIIGIGTKTDKQIEIPAFYKGLPVLNIGYRAFYGTDIKGVSFEYGSQLQAIGNLAFAYCIDLEYVWSIPSTVTIIENAAFYYCMNLKSFNIPFSISTIGSSLFENCVSLKNLYIPSTITSIESGALKGCSNLTELTIPFVGSSLNGTSYTHFGYIFGADMFNQHKWYIPSSLKKITVTGGNNINDYAFYGCFEIEEIRLPDGLISIGKSAFVACYAMGKILIPDSVVNIGNEAFASCYALTEFILPQNLISINSSVFDSCKSLKDISIPEKITSIGIDSFRNCSNLMNVTMKGDVTYVGDYAFAYCTSLINFLIPKSITNLGGYVFNACSSLQTIRITGYSSIPSGWNNNWNVGCAADIVWNFISNDIFTTGLEFTVMSEGYEVRYGTATAIEIIIPSIYMNIPVIKIADFGFRMSNIEKISLPDSITQIGSNAFAQCSKLMNIELPKNLILIDNFAFEDCIKIESILIPNSVELMGSSAFKNWKYTQTINIEGYLTKPTYWSTAWAYMCGAKIVWDYYPGIEHTGTIGLAFNLISGGYEVSRGTATVTVTEIILPSTFRGLPVIKIANMGFQYSSITSITIPESIITIGFNAFFRCTKLTSLDLPNNLLNIETSAFEDCVNINNIVIPNNIMLGGYVFAGWTSSQTVYIQGYSTKPDNWYNDWNKYCAANIIWNY